MKSMLKDAAILFAITIISGAILGFVFDMTKTPIAEQEAKAKSQACQEVFADAVEFEIVESQGSDMTAAVAEGGYGKTTVDEVVKAKDSSGNVLGYVLTVTSKEGYAGDITFSMGIRNDGTLNGISILSISETAGLGMRAEEVLKPQFANKNVTQFSYTKTGAASADQIDAISSATITTNAVTNSVNAGLYCFHTVLQEGGGSNE